MPVHPRGASVLCVTLALAAPLLAAVTAPSLEPWGRQRLEPVPRAERTEAVLFSEDFENGWNGWSGVDLTAASPTWHTDDFNAWNGGQSWWMGLEWLFDGETLHGYHNHTLQYLETPVVTVGAAPAQLSFRLRYATEAPGGEPAGYNAWDGCNVWVSVDGGAWAVATGFSWAYTHSSLYSFGNEFGMGTGIPGWCGNSVNWRAVTKDLAAYVGHTVSFRFAFCADGGWDTEDEPGLFGMLVDDVLITANGNTVLQNDAEGVATPSDLLPVSGGASGDHWTLSTASSHSPSHAANGSVGDGLENALVSPAYLLPADQDCWLEFWLRCDLQDFDGNGDNFLEDYYFVEVSADDGATWETLFYDYGDADRPGAAAWEDYLPGMPFNGNAEMSLNQWAGQEIRLRWRVRTDWDNDGGTGTGLWIDDVEIWGSDVPVNDVACVQIVPGYPRTLGVPCQTFTQFDNNGSEARVQIQGWMAANGSLNGPILPRMDIAPLSSVTRLYTWTPSLQGENELQGWAANPGDQVPANDTLWVSPIEVRPAGQYEFGYSFREPTFFFSGDDPAMFVNDLSRLGLGTLDVETVTLGLYDPDGDAGGKVIRVHLLDDEAGQPGDEIWSGDYTLTTQGISTLWEFEVEPGVQVAGDFWVWAERLDGYPHALGADLLWNPGHYCVTDGTTFDLDFSNAEGSELMLWVLCSAADELAAGAPRPRDFALDQAVPNPFNPGTLLSFHAPAGTPLSLKVYNLRGQEVASLYEGPASGQGQTATFDGARLASGVYFARLEGAGQVSTLKLVLSR